MPAVGGSKYRVEAAWQDAPHLGEKERAEMLAATPMYLRDARSKGIPSMGSGAVYPYAVEQIKCEPFRIPDHFRRGFSLDDGWNVTSVGFWAYDPDQDILYRIAELYLKEHKPDQVARMVETRGKWLPGVGDAAARTRDGDQVIAIYQRYLPKMNLADKEVEAGIYDVTMRLATGRLKIFSTCQNALWEYQRYRRDEKGKIVKQNDHAMDDTRYACRPSAIQRMIAKPVQSILPSQQGLGGGDPVINY
jgi:hypothetical protein